MGHKFKLQSVLNYRKSLEDQAQQVLTATLQRKSELEQQQRQAQAARQQLDTELKQRQQEGLSIAEIGLFESQIQHHQRQVALLQQQLVELEEQILLERQQLLTAARERQVMEKLKDKQQAEYMQELSRKEREMLDEISLRSKGDKS